MFLPGWTYDGKDPGLKLFTLANAKLPAKRHADVLELGAHDTDWIERARKCEPSNCIYGIDWRGTARPGVQQADVLTVDMPFAKDVVIAISAVEHFGLGHYNRDPLDPYGDIKAVQRVREWIAPRQGFFYFDVPYAPEGYRLDGTRCRIYDDKSLRERFGPHEVLGYVESNVNGWIEKPTKNVDPKAPWPYYYVALLVRN